MLAFVRSVEDFRHRFARQVKVNDSEIRALGRIAEAGSITPKRLADMLALTTGTVTSLIDRLEKVGLIVRTPNPRDRRSILLRLTPDGLTTMTEMYDSFQTALLEAVTELPLQATLYTSAILGEASGGLDRHRAAV
jgi:DNA-binding MarR family transcriptional regulator